MKMIVNRIMIDTYMNREDDASLQQISIISRVSVAIPFYTSQRISIRRLQIPVA